MGLDFSAAFDGVNNHRDLIYKIQLLIGIGGTILGISREFLNKRRQKLCVDGQYSDFMGMISGVP